MPFPFVIKPTDEGSSIGVCMIFNTDDLSEFSNNNSSLDDVFLVEKYIPGREIHVVVLKGKAQNVTEIIFPGVFFDYEAKYNDERTKLITPAVLPENIFSKAMEYAEKIFREIGCEGIIRCDFRYDDSQDEGSSIYFLEVNTIPQFDPGSIAALQPQMNGISFSDLCSILVEDAIERKT